MATRVWESAIINAPIDDVYNAIRPLDFKYNPSVSSAGVEEKKSASEVGAVIRVQYKDNTVQRIKTTEISDASHSVTWELIESVPPVPILSVVHTVKLRRVTENNSTFIEWITDFSKDADSNVIADARFKQKDNFNALEKYVSSKKKAPVGGMKVIYDPEKARQGVLQTWADLQALHKLSNTQLGHAELKTAVERYKAMPVTWQINWEIANMTPETAQKVADEVRDRLNGHQTRLGSNALPLPRLFNAGN
jgi:hypothetical protein